MSNPLLDWTLGLGDPPPRIRAAIALNLWSNLCHEASSKAGWWDGVDRQDPTVQASKIALIHSELSEALEGVRKGKPDDHLPHRSAVEVELADALIRIFDLAGSLGLDLGGAATEKLEYNTHRADHKREARSASGGKRL